MMFHFLCMQNHSAYQNLAVAYSEIGDHKRSIDILNKLIKRTQVYYCLDNKPSSILSIPYAWLCSAYYYNGERDKAYAAIQKCMECLDCASSHLQSKLFLFCIS